MSPINGFIAICLLFVAFFTGCFFKFLSDYESDRCEMTYMFEYPQFVRIQNKIDVQYNKYGLFAYSEGRLTEKVRKMEFDGIPVLYIPGSGGSFKQARSFASIALRKGINSRTPFHFDYFTVDLNNELSGLNGAILHGQMQYVNYSLNTILHLYEKSKFKPQGVVLIGHSMGGVIAHSIVSKLPPESTLVPLVLSLSSPLKRPVINMDYYMNVFYEFAEDFKAPNNTAIIAIGGGYNDFMVPSFLTSGSTEGILNVMATCVPKSWVSPNHLQVVWCKQLVMAINRALFESVNLKLDSSFIRNETLDNFRHHLVKHNGLKTNTRQIYKEPIKLSNSGNWVEKMDKQFSIRLPYIKINNNFMFDLMQGLDSELTVVGVNVKPREWIFICPVVSFREGKKICEVGRHLSQFSEIAPSIKHKRRILRINMHDLKALYPTNTHVIMSMLPSNDPVVLHVDIFNRQDRTIEIPDLNRFMYTKQVLIEKTHPQVIDYELQAPNFNHILHSYWLYLEPSECTQHEHHAVASLIVPWDNQEMHGFVTDDLKGPIQFRLQSSRPNGADNAKIRLTLDPSCRYKISIQSTYNFGNIARFYTPLLIGNIVCVILLTLRSQLYNIWKNEQCPIFFSAMKNGCKPFYVIPVVQIVVNLSSYLTSYPVTDWHILIKDNLSFTLLPMLLYFTAVGIVWSAAIAFSIALVCFESTFNKLALKLISKTFKGTASWSDHIMKAFQKIPGILAMLLVAMSVSTSGGLALCLAATFYFIKLTQMSQDLIEDFVKGIFKNIGSKVLAKVKNKCFGKKSSQKQVLPLENNEPTDAEDKTNATEDAKETKDVKNAKKVKEDKNKAEQLIKRVSVEDISTQESSPELNKFSLRSILSHLTFNFFKEIMENNEIFFHFTIFLLYVIVAALNVPSVLTWAHNYKYRPADPDPALIPATILSLCAIPLWQFEFPKINRYYYREASYIIYGAALDSVLFGILSIHRLSYLISAVVALITLHQILAPRRTLEDPDSDNDDDSYDRKVKTKWD